MKIMKWNTFILIVILLSALASCQNQRDQLAITSTIQPTVSKISPTPTYLKSVPSEYKNYIGIEYPPLPKDLSSGFGRMILADTQYPFTEFAIDIVNGSEQEMVWMSKLSRRDDTGRAYFTVVDIIVLPSPENKDEVFIPNGCNYEELNEVDPEIMVTAILDTEAYKSRYLSNDKILKAWRADRSKEAIEEISSSGIVCFADDALELSQ